MGYYLFNRPRRDGRLSWLCWLTDSGCFTHRAVKRPSISLAQDREGSPARTDVLTTMLHHQLRSRTHNLSIVSPTPYRYYTTEPRLCDCLQWRRRWAKWNDRQWVNCALRLRSLSWKQVDWSRLKGRVWMPWSTRRANRPSTKYCSPSESHTTPARCLSKDAFWEIIAFTVVHSKPSQVQTTQFFKMLLKYLFHL